MADSTMITKPFLKWVGGKTQIIDQVVSYFPRSIHNYYEPFIGGGSVLLAMLSMVKSGNIQISGRIYASDINPSLVGLYKNVQLRPDEFIREIRYIIDDFNTCIEEKGNKKPENYVDAKTSKESYYYWIRQSFNRLTREEKSSVRGSAMFLFINKTCFRGVYREGPNGINVPYGHYKNPSVIDDAHIRNVSELIRNVIFTNACFQEVFETIKNTPDRRDFIYLDPPYVPEKATSFVGYTSDGFDLQLHNKLFKYCDELSGDLNRYRVRILLSNALVPLISTTFQVEKGYTIKEIVCRRSINSKDPSAVAKEVLITNYSVDHPNPE